VNVLLDTDIAIEILRARDQAILARWKNLAGSSTEILCSPVVAAEIWAGARPGEFQMIDAFFDALTCVAMDYDTGRIAGELLRRYARSHSLEVPDALIAGAALQHQAALWTRNRKHYPVPQLTFC
jgi:predicted nucleic acid-binding protein